MSDKKAAFSRRASSPVLRGHHSLPHGADVGLGLAYAEAATPAKSSANPSDRELEANQLGSRMAAIPLLTERYQEIPRRRLSQAHARAGDVSV
jgi:hypothetical protein